MKKILSLLLAIVMIVPMVGIRTEVKVEAVSANDLKVNTNYMIVSRSTGKAMTVEGNSGDNSAKICQMPAEGYESQVWTLRDAGNGYYFIVNKFSGLVIDVPWASTEAGTEVAQFGRNSADNQQWKIEDVGDGYSRITPKLAENLALNISGNSNDDGAKIIQWYYGGAANEQWEFREVSDVKINPELVGKIRITCVGDSITDGVGASGNSTTYPRQLQTMLGNDYYVTKCGASGAFACESQAICWFPYTTSDAYAKSLESSPDVVIMMIGTNDASEDMCWGKTTDDNGNPVNVPDEFRKGYENLIKKYLSLPTKPRLIVATPLTVIGNQNREVNNVNGTIPIIRELAAKYDLTLVDMHGYTADWTNDNYLTDGLHPNDAGYTKLAERFKEAVLNELEDSKIRVTCVGDSITEGYGATNSANSYPSKLQSILGDDFAVYNAGVSAKTVIRSDGNAYNKTDRYTLGLQSNPDAVIIMLGTNDAVLSGIDTASRQEEFKNDYAALIEEYKNCGSNPQIMLALPTTCDSNRHQNNQRYIIPIIKSLAETYNLPLLDTHEYTALWTRDNYLYDGLHPNDAGYELLAEFFAGYIKMFAGDLKEDTNYTLIAKSSGKAMTVRDNSADSGAQICQMQANSYESQVWTLKNAGDGYYQIINKYSGKALEVPDSSTKEGTKMIQADISNGDNQKWKIVHTESGYYKIIPKLEDNFALNIEGNFKNDGDAIIQWKYSGAANEKWRFQVVDRANTNPGEERSFLKLEAEQGEATAGATSVSSNKNSNGFYVGNLGGPNNGTVTFQIYADRASEHIIKIYYCTYEQRLLQVKVNGEKAANISCSGTGDWDLPNTQPFIVNVSLKEGNNTIQFCGIDAAYSPNLDCIEVELTEDEADKTEILMGLKPAEPAKVEINGSQISTTVEGYRVIYSYSDPNNEVEQAGLIYGLSDYSTESDMVVDSTNDKVHVYAATENGKTPVSYSDMDNAQSYAMTMKFIKTAEFYNASVDVRAYIKLKDGTYTYSDIANYKVYDVANYLYQNKLMSNVTAHEYLYNNILSVVNPSYQVIDSIGLGYAQINDL